jgi:Ribbon-helix-helix protein, copG family
MVRTQVSLTDEQMRRLRAEARRRQMPIAAIVREAVDRAVPADPGERQARFQRALAAVGRFDSGSGDVSAKHDEIAGDSRW